MTDLTLTITRLIPVDAKRLFDAWLDPEMLSQFWMPFPGTKVGGVTTDGTSGGRFEIIMKGEEGDFPIGGTYTTVTPHSHLAFTWESVFAAPGSTVAIDFEPQGDGTLITLHHRIFSDEESRDNHGRGWKLILETLASVVESSTSVLPDEGGRKLFEGEES